MRRGAGTHGSDRSAGRLHRHPRRLRRRAAGGQNDERHGIGPRSRRARHVARGDRRAHRVFRLARLHGRVVRRTPHPLSDRQRAGTGEPRAAPPAPDRDSGCRGVRRRQLAGGLRSRPPLSRSALRRAARDGWAAGRRGPAGQQARSARRHAARTVAHDGRWHRPPHRHRRVGCARWFGYPRGIRLRGAAGAGSGARADEVAAAAHTASRDR